MATVRRATRRDLKRLADLCRAAVGPDDYVLDYLDAMVAAGEVWVVEDDRTAASGALLAGGPQVLVAARRAARARGCRSVALFVPRDPRILAWARRAGYAGVGWGSRAVLYERPVPRGGGRA